MIDDINDSQEEKAIAIAMITEKGDVNWILSEDISIEQERMFKKIYAVTVKPSIVLLFFLHLEIFLLNFILYLERIFKGKNNE
jgi:hypothetical protein